MSDSAEAIVMRVMRFALLIAVMFGTAVACSPAASSSGASSDPATVKAAIEATNARFLEAFKRGDKAGMLASYTDDAVLMMPNEPAWRGRSGIEKGLDGFLGQVSLKDGGTTTGDVMVSGDMAVETGTFTWTLQSKTGGADIKDQGKYLTVWKRQADGSWKAVRDINNSDLPASKGDSHD